jgi:hypothetical protein
MPDLAATDNHGQVDFVGQTVAMFFIGEDIGGQGHVSDYGKIPTCDE